MASSSEARAARGARRSFSSARVWSGVTDEVAASLHSDDETLFGSDLETVDSETPPSSPLAKRPRLYRAKNAPTYLPASETYSSVYIEYCEVQQEEEERVSLSTFKRIWHGHLPDIIFMTPRQDVCARCEQFRNNLRSSLSEQDRKDITENWLMHINSA